MRPKEFKGGDVIFTTGGLTLSAHVHPLGTRDLDMWQYIMTRKGVMQLQSATDQEDWKVEKTDVCELIDKALDLVYGPETKGIMTILSGPSGSGKSYWAKRQQGEHATIRINRDDLRGMALSKWNHKREKFIIEAEKALVATAHALNYDVIIDDTNLTLHHLQMWTTVGKELGFKEIKVKEFRPTLEEAIHNDSNRFCSKKVGRAVIERQFLRGGLAKFGKKIVICDLDGTLFDGEWRSWMISGVCSICEGKGSVDSGGTEPWGAGIDVKCGGCEGTGKVPKDWPTYLKNCIHDPVNEPIADKLSQARKEGKTIVLVSGRPMDLCANETLEGLKIHHIPYDHLFMRQEQSHIKDHEVKRGILHQMYECGVTKEQIEVVYDDRLSVIAMWREEGLLVEEVHINGRVFD